jgi:outer membrane translocation and assembly module TamA
MRPFGFPAGHQEPSRDDRWVVRLKVTPGPPVVVKSVDVEINGPGSEDAALNRLATASPLQPGTRLDHQSYDRLRNDLLRTALEHGFLDAQLTRRELIVNPVERTASAHLALETGGQYRFGAIEIEQDVLRDELLDRFVRFESGQVFSNDRIRSTQFALEDSNFFSTVTISPGQRDPATLTVPVDPPRRSSAIYREPRLRYRHGPARPFRLGEPTCQHPRPPAALRADGLLRAAGGRDALHHPGRRPSSRKT